MKKLILYSLFTFLGCAHVDLLRAKYLELKTKYATYEECVRSSTSLEEADLCAKAFK